MLHPKDWSDGAGKIGQMCQVAEGCGEGSREGVFLGGKGADWDQERGEISGSPLAVF